MNAISYLVYTQAFAAENDSILGPNFETIVTTRSGAESFFQNIQGMIASLAGWLLSLIAILCVFMIIFGGYQYLFGAVEGEGKGKQTIIYALSGLVVSLLAYVMVATLLGVFGVVTPIVPEAPLAQTRTAPSKTEVSASGIQKAFATSGIILKDGTVKVDGLDPNFAGALVQTKNLVCGDGSCPKLEISSGTDSHEKGNHLIGKAVDISVTNGNGLQFFQNM